ncbi:MAG: SWIM zinc finger family protein [Cyanobacteria bacterium P01_G01_bin.39]
MGEFSRTWWGQKFIKAIESFTDSARLGRGRSYARGSKILEFAVNKGKIEATIRGSINPYFGVYTEPRYHTVVKIKAIAKKDWTKIIQSMATNASFVSKLLLNEVPENIESSFREVNQNLLPHSESDFQTSCSCPDYSNPCKHIAGLCYRFASELDEDPFLVFELRGLTKKQLHQELAKTPLGRALVAGLKTEELALNPITSYYTRPQTKQLSAVTSLKEFWQGKTIVPPTITETRETNISGILVKKAGDFPEFWHRDTSFIATMDELYQRVKTKNRDLL